jgi:hypothetical protein
MRLLEISGRGELGFTEYLDNDIPRYAILSHTWGRDNEEVNFNDLETGLGKDKQGYSKIQFCQEQAHQDAIQHFWVDTCCIDKSSNAELAEAIISMYQWYRNAAKCYVLLSDVSTRKRDNEGSKRSWEPAFRKSRWFTRGWTLQELLAPTSVEFFSREGVRLGDKGTLEQMIHEITSIPIEALRGTPLDQFPVQERVRWAEQRQVTIEEDRAYCLLGIFEVIMHPLYGEGKNAFIRLKDEIRNQLDLAGNTYISSTPPSLQKRDPDSAFNDNTEGTASYGEQSGLQYIESGLQPHPDTLGSNQTQNQNSNTTRQSLEIGPPTDSGYASLDANKQQSENDDSWSINTDNETLVLEEDLKYSLARAFFTEAFNKLNRVANRNQRSVDFLMFSLPELLKNLSIELKALAKSEIERNAAIFIRHHRR